MGISAVLLHAALCGIAASDSEGPDTVPGEFPWALELRRLKGDKWTGHCAATLIHPQVALTAAYCVGKQPTQNMTGDIFIRAGEWDTSNELEKEPHQDRKVMYFVQHPKSDNGPVPKKKVHDIAVLLAERPFDITKNVGTIPMASAGDTFVGKRCTVAGWGKDARDEDNTRRTTMKKVLVPVQSNADCKENALFKKYDFSFPQGTMCAGGEAKKDACTGDGGAGLTCPTDKGPVLKGIVSWGVGCGIEGQPGVYTDVAKYSSWVREVMAEMKEKYQIKEDFDV